MSGAQILEFGPDPRWGNLSFPDLEARFEKNMDLARSITDLDHLARSIQPLFKDGLYGPDELAKLKKLRQKLYDKKRLSKFQETQSLEPICQKITKGEEVFMKEAVVEKMEKIAVSKPIVESFSQGALRALSSINGEKFVKTAPKMLAWFIPAAIVSYFLWQQSLVIYESIGFANSAFTSAGGILMIIGFAAYHSITRSWFALLLCLYASGYETYLMISGTITDEGQIQTQMVQMNPDLVFLKEKASKSLGQYHELKARYDDPESKVFKNEWFQKNHLNPAWQESKADHAELMSKESALAGVGHSKHVTWLKILYRLGLVFLCMMLVHRFFASLPKSIHVPNL